MFWSEDSDACRAVMIKLPNRVPYGTRPSLGPPIAITRAQGFVSSPTKRTRAILE